MSRPSMTTGSAMCRKTLLMLGKPGVTRTVEIRTDGGSEPEIAKA